MEQKYIECQELSGKTISSVRIYRDTGDGTVLGIELTDGTSFACTICSQPFVKASLYKSGAGTPQIIREYDM